MGDRGHNRHEPKRGGAVVPFSRGGRELDKLLVGETNTFVDVKASK